LRSTLLVMAQEHLWRTSRNSVRLRLSCTLSCFYHFVKSFLRLILHFPHISLQLNGRRKPLRHRSPRSRRVLPVAGWSAHHGWATPDPVGATCRSPARGHTRRRGASATSSMGTMAGWADTARPAGTASSVIWLSAGTPSTEASLSSFEPRPEAPAPGSRGR
jgi:hypothetical protein